MNREDLAKAIGEIDEKLVHETAKDTRRNRMVNWGIFLVVVSIIVGLSGIIGGVFRESVPQNSPGLIYYGFSPLAVFLLSVIVICLLNAVFIFAVYAAMVELAQYNDSTYIKSSDKDKKPDNDITNP